MKSTRYVQVIVLTVIIVGSFSFASRSLTRVSSSDHALVAAIADIGGLVAHYSFDDGGVTGKVNNARQFTTADDEFSVTQDVLGTGPLTISAWIKVDSCPTSYCGIVSNGQTILYFDTAYNRIQFVSNLYSPITTPPGSYIGQWVHVTATRDATGAGNVYVNGTSVASGSSGTPIAGSGLNVGIGVYSISHFVGAIDEVRIYNKVLQASEIMDIYTESGGTSGGGGTTAPPPPTSTPINGVCGSVVNTCTSGTFTDQTDSSTHNLWQCTGSGGGASASCSLLIPQTQPRQISTSGEIIPSNRRIDWKNTGVPGGIPNRTVKCTVAACAALENAATQYKNGTADAQPLIQAALTAAPDNTYVYIPEGRYLLNTTVNFNRRANVTLRGAGPGKTVLLPKGSPGIASGGSGYSAARTIIGGSTKGSTSITVSDASGIQAGTVLDISQDSDPDFFWHRWSPCNGCTGQFVIVTSVNGNTITFNDPLVWSFTLNPKFRYQLYPGMRWSGIEDMTITADESYPNTMILLTDSYASWIKNVETSWGKGNAHISLYNDLRMEIRDSYIHDTHSTTDGYGIETVSSSDVIYGRGGTTGLLVENNIFSGFFHAIILETEIGSNFSYNYFRNSRYVPWPTDQVADINANHGPHGMMDLFEGNIAVGFINDGYHGSTGHLTLFRNNFSGKHVDPARVYNVITVNLKRYSYYHNVVGNVLGFSPFPPTIGRYEMSGQPNTNQQAVIYALGYPNVGNNAYSLTNPPSNGDDGGLDPKVETTLFRWGNYDYFNNGTRWNQDEVPLDMLVPGTQSLPASLYLSGKPAWFGTLTFPPIGPDVSGMVNKIPAQVCYEQGKMPNCLVAGSGSTQPPPTTYKAGDFNRDGSVNTVDYSLMQGAWNTNNATYDLTKDGTVNTLDYAIMVKNWTN